MSKHTPAPWSVHGANAVWGNPQHLPIGRTDFTRVTGPINKEADAALISAAPELLAALQAIMAEVAGVQKDNKYEAARAAIAKATGG
jgi:hypothetical protein